MKTLKSVVTIAGVILAAGKATRIGICKQLLPFKDKTILEQVVTHARKADLAPLMIVLGHDAEKIQHQIDLTSTHVVIARQYAAGQSASLKAGVAAVPLHCDGALFLLGDQPLITTEIIDKVVVAYRDTLQDIIIPTYQGVRGNPVLIARSLFHVLDSITGDTGARVLFERYPKRVKEIEMGSKSPVS